MFEVRGEAPEPLAPHPYGPFVPPSKSTPTSQFLTKWKRRLITIPLYTLLFLFVLAILPITLPLLLLTDTIKSIMKSKSLKFLPYSRIYLFFLLYLTSEFINIYFFGFLFYAIQLILKGLTMIQVLSNRQMVMVWQRLVYTAQYLWGCYTLFAPAIPILGIHTKIHNLDLVDHNSKSSESSRSSSSSSSSRSSSRSSSSGSSLGSGPFILFMRHSSFADTLIPQYLFSPNYRMRYIVKSQLLYDPGLDILGSRSPNIFLNRTAKGESMNLELEAISNLISDYQPNSNIITVLWPEGTRYSSHTRSDIISKMKAKGLNEFVQKAEALKNVLMPRMGAVFALLESNEALAATAAAADADADATTPPPAVAQVGSTGDGSNGSGVADILFCVNFGLEKIKGMGQVINGSLVGGEVEVEIWRVPAIEVPKSRKDKEEWMYSWWKKMDDWVEERIQREIVSRKKK